MYFEGLLFQTLVRNRHLKSQNYFLQVETQELSHPLFLGLFSLDWVISAQSNAGNLLRNNRWNTSALSAGLDFFVYIDLLIFC